MIFAAGEGPSARNAPARSTQSRLTITSALRIAGTLSGVTSRGAPACSGWSVGKLAPIFRSVTTMALSASASATRAFQAASLREARPARITTCLADLSRAAAFATRSAGAAVAIGHVARHVKRRQLLGELRLLHLGVEIDVDRALRRGVGDPGGADQRLARGAGRSRLVVPFGVVAHQRALVARGVDPVDPGPAFDRIDRAGGAKDEHRHAVAPGVEHRHGRVLQPDIGMHRRGHRLAVDFGIAVRDGDRRFLVHAKQHLRHALPR